MRGNDREIAVGLLDLLQEILQPLAKGGSLRQPKRQPLPYPLGESEEFHFLAELAVIPLLGFLHQSEVFVKHGFLREGYAIYTGKHLALLVSSPVCTCNGSQLDRLYDGCIPQMRPAAQVGEMSVRIESDGPVLKFAYELALVLVAFLSECLHRFILGHFPADETLVLTCKLHHLVFHCLQVGLRNLSVSEIHVIVETVLDSRPYTELHSGIEGFERLRHKVR